MVNLCQFGRKTESGSLVNAFIAKALITLFQCWHKTCIARPSVWVYATAKGTTGSRGVAQLVEHRSPKPGVVGSSPPAPAKRMND